MQFSKKKKKVHDWYIDFYSKPAASLAYMQTGKSL